MRALCEARGGQPRASARLCVRVWAAARAGRAPARVRGCYALRGCLLLPPSFSPPAEAAVRGNLLALSGAPLVLNKCVYF